MIFEKSLLFLLMIIFMSGLINASCPSGLVSYWQFDGNVNDYMGVNSITANGGSFTGGKVGQSAYFDGNDSMTAGSSGFSTSQGTIMLWTRPHFSSPSGTTRGLFCTYGSNSGRMVYYYDTADSSFDVVIGTNTLRPSPLYFSSDSTWINLAVTWSSSGNYFRVYHNGVLRESGSYTSFNHGQFNIGRKYWNGWTQYYLGRIDEFAVFDRALSSGEISSLYSKSNAGDSYCAACGDGNNDASEACDDGNVVNEICGDGVLSANPCNSDCTSLIGSESCDDSNTNGGDGCNYICQIEPNATNYEGLNLTQDFDLTVVNDLKLVKNSASVNWNGVVNVEGLDFNNNLNMGSNFVSLNIDELDSSLNSSANVSLTVDGCENIQVYYSPSGFFSDFASLKADGNTIPVPCDGTYCSNLECIQNTLTFTVNHFDGWGGEGDPPAQGIPEFNFLGIILISGVAALGMYLISKRN